MQKISDTNRSAGYGQISFKDRNIGDDFEDDLRQLISDASKSDILSVFHTYGLEINEFKNKCQCPLHNDNTPSFYYYKKTNSYYCFGCHRGGGPIDFVAAIENISKTDAAKRLVSDFDATYTINLERTFDFAERQKLHLMFSNITRSFIINHNDSDETIKYVEQITFIFDQINIKHNLDVVGLKSLIDKLIIKLNQYNQL